LLAIYEDMPAQVPQPDVAHVEDQMIPGPRYAIRVRIYRPDLADGHQVITCFHDSAFVICSVNAHDLLCRYLGLRADAVVMSVE
jgi:acetyl esterase